MKLRKAARRLPSLLFLLSVATVIVTVFLASACRERENDSDDACPAPTRASCISGQQVSCPCPDGTMSVQTCLGTGYSLCQCSSSELEAGQDADDDASRSEEDGGTEAAADAAQD
jgi:hypothetical protein